MKIALASDHAGFSLKEEIRAYLEAEGIPLIDYGCYSEERANYVEFGSSALRGVVGGECDRAVLVCGTGLGMGILANKFRGIRGTPCVDDYSAEMSRSHNDSNCLTLGGRILPVDEALHIVRIWLKTPYEGGRHQERLDDIAEIERLHFK
jgi:ribose 5-phosphate isomerase B